MIRPEAKFHLKIKQAHVVRCSSSFLGASGLSLLMCLFSIGVKMKAQSIKVLPLCACGCGKRVKTPGSKYAWGHARRLPKPKPEDFPFCTCGCGKRVLAKGNKFIHNHHMNCPEYRENAAEYAKTQWQDPEFREKGVKYLAQGSKKRWETPGERERQSERSKAMWKDPEYRKNEVACLSKSAKKQWQDPMFRAHIKALWADPDKRLLASQKSTEANLQRWADPEYYERTCEAMRNAVLVVGSSRSVGKNEHAFFESLRSVCNYQIVEQYNVYGYVIDGYLPEVNIAIEFDEPYHFSEKGRTTKDFYRMGNIAFKVGCSFIRVEEKEYLNEKERLLIRVVKTIGEIKNQNLPYPKFVIMLYN